MNILNAEKISKTYGEKVLFDKVVLGVNKGDKIGVIGVNGTGKSTFLKIIAGIEEPDAGEIVSGRGVTVSYLAQAPQFNPGDPASAADIPSAPGSASENSLCVPAFPADNRRKSSPDLHLQKPAPAAERGRPVQAGTAPVLREVQEYG